MPKIFRKIGIFAILFILLALMGGGSLYSNSAIAENGASLSLRPSSGTFVINNTFDVSILLNTNNQSVNAVDAILNFPADKLQVVSPSLGQSVIGIWVSQPTFNNQSGTLRFQGGIPSPGINTSSGVISTITFRVKSIGTATVTFSDASKVLLNDGVGTNILTNKSGGIFNLILPPPAGPLVISATHPDQTKWQKNNTVIFEWATDEKVDGYSYVLNEEPVDMPDDISEGKNNGVAYKNLNDGVHYFHIKTLRGGLWGGITHYAVKIDLTPPADFKLNISPSARTTSRLPVIDFATTDNLSGIEHYELKIVPLDIKNASSDANKKGQEESFFIETEGRYIPEKLELGNYDVIVRAFDRAGNVREVIQALNVLNPFFNITEIGLRIADVFVIPWIFIFIAGIIFIIILGMILWSLVKWHKNIELRQLEGALNDPTIQERLKYLREKQKTYKNAAKNAIIFLLVGAILTIGFMPKELYAAKFTPLVPPTITTISKDITNDQLFYIGGNTDITGAEVVIYLQNLQDNQVLSATVISDEKGEWFYTYKKPLISGKYFLWTQLKLGNELSPPSPQNEITVSRTAIQIGASRLSYEMLYFIITLMLFFIILILIIFIAYHYRKGRNKHSLLVKEIKEAEVAVRVGFLKLKSDIEAEITVIHKAKMGKALSEEEERKEKQLLADLESITKYVKKEVFDIEKAA